MLLSRGANAVALNQSAAVMTKAEPESSPSLSPSPGHSHTLVRTTLTPLRLVVTGHLHYLIPLCTLAGGAVWVAQQLHQALLHYLEVLGTEEFVLEQPLERLTMLAPFVAGLTVAPFLLAVLVIPIRDFTATGGISALRLIRELAGSTRLGARTAFAALQAALYLLLPVVGLGILYWSLTLREDTAGILRFYEPAAILLSIPFFLRTVPVLLSPIVAIAGRMAPPDAITLAREGTGPEMPFIIVVLLAGTGAIAAALHLLPDSPGGLQPAIIAGTVWYVVSVITAAFTAGLEERYGAPSSPPGQAPQG